MKRLTLLSILFASILSTGLFCEEVKQKTNDDLIAEILKMNEEIKEEEQKQEKLKERQVKAIEKTKALKKLNQTTDKLIKTLEIKK